MNCDRCHQRPGKLQPTDGDAAQLFAAGAHVDLEPIHLCSSCRKTLEAMALRIAGPHHGGRVRGGAAFAHAPCGCAIAYGKTIHLPTCSEVRP